ncbi:MULTISPECIES: TATA-box-binding protein [Halobacteriales]|uniref:TATA-box-binding protein n=1 Tax=Halopenitus salinus TaxID=1198295 RepID=A0ABD5UWI1_9EURY|nr:MULTISPECIES: TATA-box-binding protein [Halobacteria]
MVEVVNVVASGALDVELDLEAVARDLDDVVDYDPEKYPGAYVRFGGDEPLVTLYRTGKYIITGASSEAEAGQLREKFLTLLHRHGIVSAAEDAWFTVQNYVCMADMERSVNLSALAIGLGLEVTEYEPEQFPGLVYRPHDHACVLLVFATGKVVITGAQETESAEAAFAAFRDSIETLLADE